MLEGKYLSVFLAQLLVNRREGKRILLILYFFYHLIFKLENQINQYFLVDLLIGGLTGVQALLYLVCALLIVNLMLHIGLTVKVAQFLDFFTKFLDILDCLLRLQLLLDTEIKEFEVSIEEHIVMDVGAEMEDGLVILFESG